MAQYALVEHLDPENVGEGGTMKIIDVRPGYSENRALVNFCEDHNLTIGDISRDWQKEHKKFSIVKICT